MTGDARYADKARAFILAWAEANQPDGDAINETQFEPLIVSYDLLRGTFSTADRLKVDGWLRHKATVLWNDRRGLSDNWFSHRLKVAGLIGWTIDDGTLVAEAVDGFHRQINRNFKPDGASTDFYLRDALHYHLYDVEPLLTLARTAERSGQKFFDYPATNGATLQRGVDFVVPFANGTKTHVEFVNSKVKFDQKRAQNGQGEYQPHVWNPHAAIGLFSAAGLVPARIWRAGRQTGRASGRNFFQLADGDQCRFTPCEGNRRQTGLRIRPPAARFLRRWRTRPKSVFHRSAFCIRQHQFFRCEQGGVHG